ncbi:MAG: tRNA preQ1(34) S-adenosylmethionine ribosyltransferase-isomerase QueA [Luteibaculaceae bacterium]
MRLSSFKFKLPAELVASYPVEHRDESRLMVIDRATGKIEHKQFKDLIDYFDEKDVMVVNNTKVFKARMYGNKEKTGAKIEVFLLRELNSENLLWDVLVDPARKIRIGNKLYFGDDDSLVAEVIDNTTNRGRTLRFLFDGPYEDFKATLMSLGEMPVPKYINRPIEAVDEERYQSIFAKEEGAVAAPTSNLHFSKHLVKKMQIKGIEFAEITNHIGLGTFRTVEVEDLTKHRMDSEQLIIPDAATNIINKSIENRGKVVAIGTATMRALESSVSTENTVKPFDGWSNKFIFPPYDFAITSALVTNFHAPESTLLMTVSAFGDYDLIMDAYETAIKEKYRFLAYGDSMLIL